MSIFKKKKREELEEIIYYNDELNGDFAGSNITPIIIDENYKYLHSNMQRFKRNTRDPFFVSLCRF